ncbi:hypothetical protein [Cellulosimicrobium sp. Marseille-Q4280]|uniref:hypothetical protein n=1 Tax=Cellulosimicrobium sp. Marseille-Q4280 TaxID=2937992 RepID=UPI00203A5DF8|nr:hypothetical protein [Cellulosimicrobium sp. Marseille-Q4280]
MAHAHVTTARREQRIHLFNGTWGALCCASLLTGCAANTYSTNEPNAYSPGAAGSHAASQSCTSLLDSIIARVRDGETSGAVDVELDALGDGCPSEYGIFADYASIDGFAQAGAGGVCSDYAAYGVDPVAIDLARRDGLCAPDTLGGVELIGSWSCGYSPTFNDDWHDDVLCTNGTEDVRPYLREWDDYVTEEEVMDSAREYEQQLNSQ